MKIVIISVENNIVNFSSKFGNGNGLWLGEKPNVNTEYYVEIDIMGRLEFGKTILLYSGSLGGISKSKSNNYNILRGKLGIIYPTGVSSIEMNEGSINFEFDGSPFFQGENIVICGAELEITPYYL